MEGRIVYPWTLAEFNLHIQKSVFYKTLHRFYYISISIKILSNIQFNQKLMQSGTIRGFIINVIDFILLIIENGMQIIILKQSVNQYTVNMTNFNKIGSEAHTLPIAHFHFSEHFLNSNTTQNLAGYVSGQKLAM